MDSLFQRKDDAMLTTSHLHRSRADALLGGVCAGLARYIGADPALIRLAWVLAAFLGGTGLLMYLRRQHDRRF